jgi:hypothetical protein
MHRTAVRRPAISQASQELREDFRRRALLAGTVVVGLAE